MPTPAPQRAQGFAPAVTPDIRVLILGSLPGVASLAAGQYYAHPRNSFWPIMSALLGQPLVQMPYEAWLKALNAGGVGLWDVLASAERSGSLDAAIRSPEAADLRGLIDTLPALRAVAFNGAKSAAVGRKILKDHLPDMELIDLPSSSPAHARPLEDKLARWAVLAPFLMRQGQ